MTPIQPILVLLILCVGAFWLVSLRSRLTSLLVGAMVMVMGVLFVIRPNLTNAMAHLLGVGRGADLLFYLFVPASVYVLLMLHARSRALDQKLTELARSFAIAQARKPDTKR